MKIELEPRQLMHDDQQHPRDAREYNAFLLAKVALARGQVRDWQVASNDDVDAQFAARRVALRGNAGKAGA